MMFMLVLCFCIMWITLNCCMLYDIACIGVQQVKAGFISTQTLGQIAGLICCPVVCTGVCEECVCLHLCFCCVLCILIK